MLRERHESTGDVAGVIRDVRARWRRKLLVRAALQVLVVSAVLLIAAGFALESLRFTPTAILTFRIGTIAAILGLAAWAFGRPLLRQVSDEQVALYLEEHEPSLNTLLLSAMSAERNGNPQEHSPALVRKLVEEADRPLPGHRRRPRHRATAGQALRAAGGRRLGGRRGRVHPRPGLPAPRRCRRCSRGRASRPRRRTASPSRPGAARCRAAPTRLFNATLSGFSADDAVLLVRKGDATSFERVPMLKGDDGSFEGMVFDLDARLEFLAEAAGVRSGTFTLDVIDLPYAQRIDLEYHFPAYTGPRTADGRGRRRHRRADRHRSARHGHADDADARPAQLTLHESANVPLAAGAEGKLTGVVRRRQGRLLPRRPAGSRRRR